MPPASITGSNTVPAMAVPSAADVLAVATQMVREGRAQDAIAYATDANRTINDPWLEYRLVRWRLTAGGQVTRGNPPPASPPSPNLFAAAGALPEVDASAVDAVVLASAIAHHGSLLVRGLITQEHACHLANGIDHVFDAMEASLAGQNSGNGDVRWYAPVRQPPRDGGLLHRLRLQGHRGGGLFIADSPRMMFELTDTFHRAGAITLVEQYLKERPVWSIQKAVLRRVPPTAGTDWHQDGAFLGPGVRAVNVWLALSECGVDAPGLDIVARRLDHIVETGTRGAKFNWSVGAPTVDMVADGAIVSPVFYPGDAIFFDPQMLHRTGVTPTMTRSRWAVESWFFAPSVPPERYYPVWL